MVVGSSSLFHGFGFGKLLLDLYVELIRFYLFIMLLFHVALTDWWLLGESDVIVNHSMLSFGHTAAMRTARPIYRASHNGDCSRMVLPLMEVDSETFPSYKV